MQANPKNELPFSEIKKLKTQQKIKQVNEQAIVQVDELDIEQVLNKHCTSTELLPYINNTNSINIANGRAKIKQDKNDAFLLENEQNTKKKLREKKGTEQIPPDWELVMAFFKDKQIPLVEAEKFYNHFQSNGWLVGGKSKMKDWKAAARNWILNSNKFQGTTATPQPNHLHTPNFKNYAEPL